MKKIAVGDLGEFWYGDYKEPFEQLEGGVPGHPVGVVLKADDGKLLCAFCGKTFDNLGNHARQTHGLPAAQYKDAVGLLQKSSLFSEVQRQRAIRHGLKRGQTAGLKGRGGARSVIRRIRPAEHDNKHGTCRRQILTVAGTIKGPITYPVLKRLGIGQHAIERHFGDLTGLRRAVGNPRGRHEWTDSDLIDALRNLAFDIGRTPAISDAKRYGLPSDSCFREHFGTWRAACAAAGLDPVLRAPAEGSDLDHGFLMAYATHGDLPKAMAQIGIGYPRAKRVLDRYGYPFAPFYRGPGRREWAADMARRLAA